MSIKFHFFIFRINIPAHAKLRVRLQDGHQKLRRTKAEVAKDLPKKIVDQSCRSLAISEMQRELYGAAIARYIAGENASGTSDRSSHLGLLAYLKTVCSDLRPPAQSHQICSPFQIC
jgi:hypothetical protein